MLKRHPRKKQKVQSKAISLLRFNRKFELSLKKAIQIIELIIRCFIYDKETVFSVSTSYLDVIL